MINCFNSSTLYLSATDGNNRFSGYSPVSDGKGNGPLKTIARLIEVIDTLRVGGNNTPITVRVMGDIEMDQAIELGDEFYNSMLGRDYETVNVTFESYGEKQARFIGGKILKGFQKDTFNGADCVSLYIPEVKAGAWKFTDLYVNGKPAKLARYPKNSTLKAVTTERADGTQLYDGSKWFIAFKEDLENIEGIEDAIVSYNHFWVDEHSPVAEYDRETGKLTMKYRSRFLLKVNYDSAWRRANLHYYLENIAAGFSSPGEWYLDVKSGMLYYIPEEGMNIEELEIIAPKLKHFVNIHGSNDKKARGIRFRNLGFIGTKGEYESSSTSATGITSNEKFAADSQSCSNAHGSLRFENAEDCIIDNCDILCVGTYAVEIYKGCNNIRVENSRVVNCGAGGVKIYGAAAEKDDDIRPTGNNAVCGCLIKNCGLRYAAGCGVLVCHSAHNEISCNEICHLEYSGVSVGWVWGYGKSTTFGNIIRNNHIHHIGQGRLSDMGGIYLLGKQHGTAVSGNIIHDVVSSNYGGMGIYTDEGSSYITIENNIVFRCKECCYQHHYGKNNVLRGNIFAYGGKAIIDISKREPHVSVLAEDNIFITDGKPIFFIGNGNDTGGSMWVNNTFYDSTGNEPVVLLIDDKESLAFEQWNNVGVNCGNKTEKPSEEVMKKVTE